MNVLHNSLAPNKRQTLHVSEPPVALFTDAFMRDWTGGNE